MESGRIQRMIMPRSAGRWQRDEWAALLGLGGIYASGRKINGPWEARWT